MSISHHEWRRMMDDLMNYLPKDLSFQVKEHNQTSRNLMYEITAAMDRINVGGMATDGTALHPQGRSNLCWAFGINSGLRRALRDLTGQRKSRKVEMKFSWAYSPLILVKAGRTADEIFADNTKWAFGESNVCSFQAMLTNLICNVCPRSLEGLAGDGFIQSLIMKQPALVEKVFERLQLKSLFEMEGWRRITGCTKFMESFGINPEHYELTIERVSHPNSAGSPEFQEQLKWDKRKKIVETEEGTLSPFPTMNRTFVVRNSINTFLVSHKPLVRMCCIRNGTFT